MITTGAQRVKVSALSVHDSLAIANILPAKINLANVSSLLVKSSRNLPRKNKRYL